MPTEPWYLTDFPGLRAGCVETSPFDTDYNCIGWAATAGKDEWWWPDAADQYVWPAGVPRAVTVPAFVAALRTLGYEPCADGSHEPLMEKVALFARDGVPTHAARQLPDGLWTSKLGPDEDISHPLDGLAGDKYGTVVRILGRPRRI